MGWWKTAKPGDRVVCVDSFTMDRSTKYVEYVGGLDGLSAGETYTIREVVLDWMDGTVCLRLEEIVRPLLEGELEETGFKVSRFRPVRTKSTDTGMAILKRILNSAPVREDA